MEFEQLLVKRKDSTIYKHENCCIKVFEKNYDKADVFNEALNQIRMEEKGLHVPKVIEVKEIEGQWAIVSEYIEGKTLQTWMEENPDKKEEYIKLLIDIQCDILAKTDFSLVRNTEKISRTICGSELLATTRFDMHTRLMDMPKHNKVLHGKFYPTNIILTKEGTPYILDWSNTTIGNGAADVAKTYLLFLTHDDPEGAELYLKLFCEKRNKEEEYIKKWIPIVAAAYVLEVDPKYYEVVYPFVHKKYE